MLILDADTLRIINSLTVDTFDLYDFFYSPTQSPVRFTNLSDDMTFEGSVYTSATIKRSEMTTGSDGKINDITVSIGNANGIMQYYYENYQMSGKKLRIRQLFKGAASYIQYDYVIKSAKITGKQIDIACGLGIDVFKLSVPARTVLRNFCKWQFRDANCTYSGTDTTCSKQFADCQRKGNLPNFGGFPGVVSSKSFI